MSLLDYMTTSGILLRIYNDNADSYPQHAGKFFNFRVFIEFFIHEVKKTLAFWVLGHIWITNINYRDFYVYHGISLYEYIEIFSYTIMSPPPCVAQLPLKYKCKFG